MKGQSVTAPSVSAGVRAALERLEPADVKVLDFDDQRRYYGIWNRQDYVWVNDNVNRILVSTSERVMLAQAVGGSIAWIVAEIGCNGIPLDKEGKPLLPEPKPEDNNAERSPIPGR